MINWFRSLTEDKFVKLLSVLFFSILVALLFASSTTTDEGDSLMHYLYAKYAFRYPAHFFNQWAKPVYVLIMAPVAQLGFTAVQLLNIIFTSINFYLVYRIAAHAGIAKPWMASLIYAAMPLSVTVTFSGLTEPMFACATLLSILLLQKKRFYVALILFSFLPFIRSEGLLVCGVIFLYLLVIEKYELVPLLLVGHIFYSLTGYIVHHDLMWVFNKLSYATLSSAYGSGRWGHYFNVMPEITGVVVKYLLWAGVFYGFILLIRALRKKINEKEQQELWLVYGIFLVVFVGHIVFWALGIFNSMGLIRPIAGITPLMAIIALRGIQYFTASIQQWKTGMYLQYLLLAAVLIFPFSSNVYAYKWKRDFELKADQQAQLQLVKYIKQHYPNHSQQTMYHALPWVSTQLKQDWFDPNRHIHINDAFTRNQFKRGELFIWDDWFAVVEGNASLEAVRKDGRFKEVISYEAKDYWGNTRKTVLFEFIGAE
jgi:hypothetical protein